MQIFNRRSLETKNFTLKLHNPPTSSIAYMWKIGWLLKKMGFSAGHYLVVRGIVDYCNLDKKDEWHNYAAICAACYTKSIIERL